MHVPLDDTSNSVGYVLMYFCHVSCTVHN